jgi:Ca2+-binding RTX toxin-like protein
VGGTGADWIDAGDGSNVVIGDNAIIIQNNGALTSVESVAFADGGVDLIFTGSGNDLVIGGTAGDIIHAGAGNDLVFGDHALVSGNIDLALLPMAMAVHPFTFTSISTQNVGADGRSVAGDDVVFAGAGDDILLGQQGSDILFGEDGDDDLIGGHNVALGQDGADVIDGGAGYDVIAGDNASILRRGDNVSPRAHVLAGDAMFDDRGNLLDLDTPQAWPGSVPERDTIILDHAYGTDGSLFGNDQLVGGAGDDVLFGELGDDQMHGDATLPVTVAADGTIDRTALRATATALFTTNLWIGDAADGDDYLEGNGGADLIFGGLGQDDIVGGSSSLFGLTDRLQRPDGADAIYGGNGTQADDQSAGDSSPNGRARDADVIMGDNANIIRLVGINGVNLGAFLTFQYNTTGTLRIVVRGFDLLDYTIPAATSDIGAADKIYGEDGDDTLHGEVGDDLMYGNGNDDNLYGGQGDDNLFGGAGDDSISHSDELKAPPPAQGSGGAAEGNGAQGTAEGTIPLDLPGNVEVILTGGDDVGIFREGARNPGYVSRYTTNVGQPGQLLNTPVGLYRQTHVAVDMQGSWRVFSSGLISTGRDFAPNTPSFFDEAAGSDKPEEKKDEEVPTDNPATPQDESQPAVPVDQQQVPPAPQDGQQPPAPAGDQPAPADTKPAEGENPPPAPQDQAGTPPVPPTDTPPAT